MTLLKKFSKVRNQTHELCKPLLIEDYVPQGALYVSPAKWHIAHTTWFFETFLLKNYLDNYVVYHPAFSFLFNSYYNSVGSRTARVDRGLMTRPSVEEVYKYRSYVDEAMNRLLSSKRNDDMLPLLEIGINHEQQHQELLMTDIKFNLGLNPLHPIYKEGFSLVNDHNTEGGFTQIPAGNYEVGFNGEGFSFDNEHGRHKVYLHEAAISKSMVTNGDYLEFMEDNGYLRHDLWLDEGWIWVTEHSIKHPLYWKKVEGEWFQFTLGGLVSLDMNAQLSHVSHYEAAAFAEWKGMRLPTEFEWEVASSEFKWGSRWEHTSSAYLRYPGYKKPKGAVGQYNGKFMMNQMVLRGASNATREGHSRSTYRNFFHPNMQWQFAGIRLAKDER